MIDDTYRAKVRLQDNIVVVETDDVRYMPGIIDVPVYEGDTFSLKVRWVDAGSDEPLTSYTGTASWKSALSGGSVIQSFGASELTLSTAEPWLITLTLGTATTAGFSAWTRGVGDLKLTKSNVTTTILEMRPILHQKVA